MKSLTVAELIARLQILPQEKPVEIRVIDPYFGFLINDHTTIEYDADAQSVVIEN